MNVRSIFLSVVLSMAAVASAQQPSVHDVAKRVDDHYNHLRSLRLDYTEHYRGLGMDRTENGTLLLKKPGRMRWNYSAPVGKVFVLDGKNAYFYPPGDAQAQKIPAKQLDDLRSPLRFLLGHTQIEKELNNITMVTNGGVAQISGVPKGMEQRVKRLTITCNPQNGIITGLKLEEIDGSVTEFHFSNLKENVPVKDDDFQFTAPAGVTIVSGLPPT